MQTVPASETERTRRTPSPRPDLQILIAALPIRNRRKSRIINKSRHSNRQKNGIFLKPATRHLPARWLPGGKPATCFSNPCPLVFWRGNYNNLKPTRCSSNRNSQELKIGVTP